MSQEKKHLREEEDEPVQAAKKVKTGSEAPVKEGKAKKDKKDRKDKEGKKKEKKDKKRKDKETEQTSSIADKPPVAPALTDSEEQTEDAAPASPGAKEKRDKKEKKKEKKDKKDKKKSKDPVKADAIEESREDAAPVTGSYTQSASLSVVPEERIQDFLKEKEVTVSDPIAQNTPLRPVLEFGQLPQTTLQSKNWYKSYTAPTPIQAASWPFALSGRDVVGVAETGSGKTMAFSVPIVESLLRSPKAKKSSRDVTYPRAVIVSPTRELAMQTHDAISALAGLVGLSTVCFYGGANKDTQRSLLRQKSGADVVVATPGRLKDFLAEGCISLSEATFAVLDEADRMLDTGFEQDIKLILGSCKPREARQTLMFTATWPQEVRALAETFMVNPVKITIGGRSRGGDDESGDGARGMELQANTRITQTVEVLADPRGKEARLFQILKDWQRKGKSDRILVFCLYKKEAVRVEKFLEWKGIQVGAIHGDLGQEQRTRSLEAFKAGTVSVLVATDVAARGLDIPEVKLVINVTFPLTIADYVHRIGRTGRAGKTGTAITFFTEHDKARSGELINILKAANQPVPDELLKFGTTVKKKAHDVYGAHFKDVDMSLKPKKITFD
ncbi:RNA-dependent ATPase [Coniochaeta pulveracea]|uniref:RNA helicase n=1 Tax=Coniochaeta pulveracea TaxID=177199 RepID=A0A420XZH7_9PEZI|nr:RNA-dependent ATPase [Coniochaeta pulveracea]